MFLKKILSLRAVVPVLSRCAVYGCGFLFVLVVSCVATKDVFGRFSLVQSIVELSVILVTQGVGGIFVRNTALDSPVVSYFDLFKILIAGSVPCLFVVWLYFYRINLGFDLFVYAGLFFCVVFYSLSLVLLAVQRGEGRVAIFNVESAIRNFFSILCVSSVAASGMVITVDVLVASSLFGFVVLFLISVFSTNRLRVLWSVDRVFCSSVAERVNIFFYALSSFVLKKSDVIFFSMFMSSSYIANFKLAFLMAEASSQFSLSFYVSKTRDILDDTKRTEFAEDIVMKGVFIGLFISIMSWIFLQLFGGYFNFGVDAFSIFYVIAPCYLVRCYTSYIDTCMALTFPVHILRNRVVCEIVFKFFSYLLSFYIFKTKPEIMYLGIVAFELLLYELFYKRRIGSALMISIIRRRR